MLNLLRMDLRHMFRSRAFYICFGLLSLTCIITFIIFFMITDPEMQKLLTEHGFTITAASGDIKDAMGTTSLINLFHQTNISGGFLPVVSGILMSLYICTDFDSGFIKNILAIHENKWSYILSKMTCFSIVNLTFLAGTFLIVLGFNAALGNLFFYSSAADTLFYLFNIWMITNGFCALTLLVCIITRSKAAGITAAFVLCSGLIVLIVNAILTLFKANEIMNYTLYINLSSCPFSYTEPSNLRGIIVGLSFTVLYTVLGKLILAKKDI